MSGNENASALGSVETILSLACADMASGQFTEAFERLLRGNREHRDLRYEQLLAQCRYKICEASPPRSGDAATRSLEVDDLFAGCRGLPEIRADQLDEMTLSASIQYHGALIVRGLLDESKATQMADGIQHALDARGRWHKGERSESDSQWYWPLPDTSDLATARSWVESTGAVWTADSPRMLYELIEVLEDAKVVRAIMRCFGERPLLSVEKSTLRCVPSTIRTADWHQDGAFMGSDIRSVNVWLSLSHCGEDASGLEVLPKRLSRVLPTGSHGANFSWSVGPGMVELASEGLATVSPVFAPGDAMLFDHFFLHRTGLPMGMIRNRYAIESWFFAPSAYPRQQVPLWL